MGYEQTVNPGCLWVQEITWSDEQNGAILHELVANYHFFHQWPLSAVLQMAFPFLRGEVPTHTFSPAHNDVHTVTSKIISHQPRPQINVNLRNSTSERHSKILPKKRICLRRRGGMIHLAEGAEAKEDGTRRDTQESKKDISFCRVVMCHAAHFAANKKHF